jgi:hypothetical protein
VLPFRSRHQNEIFGEERTRVSRVRVGYLQETKKRNVSGKRYDKSSTWCFSGLKIENIWRLTFPALKVTACKLHEPGHLDTGRGHFPLPDRFTPSIFSLRTGET